MACNNSFYIQPWCYNRSISPDGSGGEDEEFHEKNEDYKEKKRKYNREWREKNAEYQKEWKEKNPEYHKKWKEKNNLKKVLEKEVLKIDEKIEKLKNEIEKLEERKECCLKLLE